MHIAIEGCAHGELDVIYNAVEELQKIHKLKVDLLICCGDFQAVRNKGDLRCMAVPEKYMHMQDFHEYYSGKKTAAILTIFIGGNHEASNHMQELPYGGWVAPNIYYMGYASVIKVGSLRIGGLSGIYKGSDYLKGHYEMTPYDQNSVRSVYHVRNLEAFRLKQISGDIDIFLSHDWPRGIYHHGDKDQLVARKRHFELEIRDNTLGSRPAEDILKKLKPKFWFSGHLHVKFAAIIQHEEKDDKEVKQTKFLALDKCLPRREFLQILELNNDSDIIELQHDVEWLTILRLTNHLLSTNNVITYMPGPGYTGRYEFTPTEEEIEETKSLFGCLTISPSDFKTNTHSYLSPNKRPNLSYVSMPEPVRNPQTEKFCLRLGVNDPVAILSKWKSNDTTLSESSENFNESELNITLNVSRNPEEVSLMESDDGENIERHDIIFALDDSSLTGDSDENPIKLLEITPKSRKLIEPALPEDALIVETCMEDDSNKTLKRPSPNTGTGPRKIIRRNIEQYSEE